MVPFSLTASTPSPTPSKARLVARSKALFQATILENPWIPDEVRDGITPKQTEFLCYEGREALFGGAAGGGKSVALLLAALQFVECPGYSAILLRRTFKQLSMSDSILDKAKSWLLGRSSKDGKVRWNGSDHTFTFPRGTLLQFGHMEHETSVINYQGGSWAFIGPDETTQFTEKMLSYPRTRQRRVIGSKIPIRWRGATNPGGISHEYIKSRYVKNAEGKSPATPDRQFFPATIEDNPHIDREDYVKQLKESGVDPITLAQLLKGDWDAVLGGRFKAEWFRYYSRPGEYISLAGKVFDPRTLPKFVTVDPAASEKTTADYTVISVWVISPWADFVWLDCIRVQKEIPDIVPLIQKVCLRWHPKYVGIESVMANTAVYQLANRAMNPIIPARPLNPRGKDKLVNATPAIHVAAAGRLWLPDERARGAFPVEDVVSEMTRFKGNDDDDHDDIVDTFSYAVQCEGTEPQGGPSKSRPSVYQG